MKFLNFLQPQKDLPNQLVAAKIQVKEIEIDSLQSVISDLKLELAEAEKHMEESRLQLEKVSTYEENVEKSEEAIQKFKLQLADYRKRIEAENADQAGRNLAEQERLQNEQYKTEIENYENRLNSAIEARQRISGFLVETAKDHSSKKNKQLENEKAKEAQLLKNLDDLRHDLDQSRQNLDALQLKRENEQQKQARRDQQKLDEIMKSGLSKYEAAVELKRTKKIAKQKLTEKAQLEEQEARKVAILSKIISEEASIEKRQRKNPILFASDKHTLPRGTNTSQVLFEREKRQQQSFNKIRKQVSQSTVLPAKEVTKPRIFDDSDDEEVSLEAKVEEVVELQKEYEVQWSGVAKEVPLSEFVPTAPKIVKNQEEASDFTAKPKVLQFLNIKPGHHYRKELLLTNISYSTSNVRFIEMSAALRGLIKLSFTPTPPLSPGMSAKVLIEFDPTAEIEVEGTLTFQTQTGKLVVPLRIMPGCIEPVLECKKVDFGNEVIGEMITKTVTITNRGDLDGEIKVKLVDLDEDDFSDEIFLAEHEENQIYKFEARSSVTIPVRFCPKIPGNLEMELHIEIAEKFTVAPWEEVKHRHNFKVDIVAVSDELPVFLSETECDFGVCLSGFLYQDEIILVNTSTTAKQVTFSSSDGQLQVFPSTGFVQSKSTFKAHVRFTPELEKADPETGICEETITVCVADQTTPLHLTVSAIVTTNQLVLGSEIIDFGKCTIHEQVVSELTITNKSLLVQEFGFLNLPTCISIRPGDGFGKILPGETLSLEVVFGAERAIDYDLDITVQTTSGYEGTFKCIATGVLTPLVCSKGQLELKTTLYDSSRKAFKIANNHFDMDQFKHPVPRIGPKGEIFPVGPTSFSIEPPKDCGLIFSPSVGTLSPGESVNVSVTHFPIISEEKILADINRPKTETKGSSRSTSTKSSRKSSAKSRTKPLTKSSPEYWAKRAELVRNFSTTWDSYKIPIFITSDDVSKNHTKATYDEAYCLWIEVKTQTCRPALAIANNFGKPSVEFETIAAQGQSAVWHLELENISPFAQRVKTTSLDPHGPFCALNPLPPVLEPGSHHVLDLRFRPNNKVGIYHEQFEVVQINEETGEREAKLHINVKGQAVDAKTQLVSDSELHFGTVRTSTDIKEYITLKNDGTQAVPYRLRTQFPFTISPQSGIVEPNNQVKLEVLFRSDKQGRFAGNLKLHLFNNPEEIQSVKLTGRAVDDAVFVADSENVQFSLPSLQLYTVDADIRQGPNFTVKLIPDGDQLVGTFFLGKTSGSRAASSKKGKDKKSSKTEYEIEWLEKHGEIALNVPLKGQIIEDIMEVEVRLLMRPFYYQNTTLSLKLTGEFTTQYHVSLTLPKATQ